MAPSREHGRSRTTIVVLVLLSITIIALDAGGFGPLNGVKSGIGTVFSPVRSAGDAVFGPIGDAWNGVFNRTDLRAENEELREQLDQLRGQSAQAEIAAAELEEMREALALPTNNDITSTHAEVVAGPVSNFDRTIQINKGANHGIRRGMPVVTGATTSDNDAARSAVLVGRVVDVSLNSSNVQLITDPGFRVGVKHALSGDIGVAQGRGEGETLRVDVGLDAATAINEGDAFTTSGVERSLFPPGLLVGLATRAIEAEVPATDTTSPSTTPTTAAAATGRTIEQVIDLEPATDLDNLTFVSVMLWNP